MILIGFVLICVDFFIFNSPACDPPKTADPFNCDPPKTADPFNYNSYRGIPPPNTHTYTYISIIRIKVGTLPLPKSDLHRRPHVRVNPFVYQAPHVANDTAELDWANGYTLEAKMKKLICRIIAKG